eukprot:CAMPEP_0115190454 /NCGR_PEP_ID=MMETSP0270-20121206/12033_1 /TAXON_ID=71861 /ORGANISM="Scrippsiella trochoidea, Strain CCMP3099" /LENGTH=285 /DNA_ID=CAMNT_0002603665 /DNA_START=53 /DNA_END=910 /DNA_ORIENTATION=-
MTQQSASLSFLGEAVQVVYYQPTRGPPELHRGWRTPDPSPTRGVSEGLPGCKSMQFFLEAHMHHKDSKASTGVDAWLESSAAGRTSSPAHRGRANTWGDGCGGSSGGDRGLQVQDKLHELSRTPSPGSALSKCTDKALPTAAWCDERQDDVRTPRGLALAAAGHPHLVLPAAAQRQFVAPARAEDFSAFPAAAPAPPPPRPPGRFVRPIKTATVQKASELGAPSTKVPLVSLGSVGHPKTCAEACKFVLKGRGCKDGAACSRCHQCEWRRYPAKKGSAAAGKALQ